MTLRGIIQNGMGGSKKAAVTTHHALVATLIEPDLLPVGTDNRFRYFSQELSVNGDGTGTTNMNADGSATPQKFTINAAKDFDIRIQTFVIVIADTMVAHNNFGGVSGPLINGWTLDVIESGDTTLLINSAKTSGEVIAQAALIGVFGDGAGSHELTRWTGNDDAHLVFFPIGQLIPGGLRLGRGTLDRVESIVNDDLTGLTEFTVRAVGYRHFP